MKKKKKSAPSRPQPQKSKVNVVAPKTNLTAIAIILLVTFITYFPALSAGFVSWDDPDYITNNISLKNIFDFKTLFSHTIQGNYHPLTLFSLAINYTISGMNAWSYHLFNIIFHLINCYLVYKLALLLSRGNPVIAVATSLFFGVHPMHVESVAWVSERKDVLYSIFFLAGLLSYTHYADSGSRKNYNLTILYFVLALLSKPAAVIFPIVLFSVDLLRKRDFNLKLMMEKIPIILPAVIMGFVTLYYQNEIGATGGAQVFSFSNRILMGFYGIMMYFIKMILPINLSPFYPFPPINISLPVTYFISPLFSLLLGLAVYFSFKKTRVIAFGILFYILNLALVLQVIPVGSAVIAERYTYIPYIGLFYIAGWLIDRYAKGNLTRANYIIIPVALVFSILSFLQVGKWKDSATLWDHAIKTQPSARSYGNRALLYKQEKNYDLAIKYYTEAIKINIADHESYTNRGNVYFDQNKLDMAYSDFKKAISLNPDYFTAMDNLGALFGLQRKYDSSMFYLDMAITKNPKYAPSYRNRGLVKLELNRNEEAIKDFEKFLELQPNDPDVLNIIGVCYRNLGKIKEALAITNRAIEIKQDPHFYLNRAFCYKDLNDLVSAKRDALVAKQGGLPLDPTLAASLGIQ
jgi:protein O-mannosyl-transferase